MKIITQWISVSACVLGICMPEMGHSLELFGSAGLICLSHVVGDRVQYRRHRNGQPQEYVYRGVDGPLVLLKEPRPSKMQFWRIIEKIRKYQNQNIIMNPEEARLLMYFADRGERTLTKSGVAFNIAFKFAKKSWATGSGPVTLYSSQGWVGRLAEEFRNMSFVLRVQPPADAKYIPDQDDMGFMTFLSPRILNYDLRNDFIYLVRYKDKWYTPDAIREKWEPLNEFTQATTDMLLSAPDDSVEDWITKMHAIYQRIFDRNI